MKLSILVPVYKQSKDLEIFLNSCLEQKNTNYEIILTIDKPNGEDFLIVEKYKELLKEKLIVFFNTKRQGTLNNLMFMTTKATGDYFIVVFPETKLKDYFLEKFIFIQEKFPADIIEFQPKFKGFFEWEPKGRIEEKQIFNIQDNKKVLAYTFPAIFNKFFNLKKFNNLAKNINFNDFDSNFLIELVYKIFMNMENYVYINEKIINEWNYGISISSPTKIFKSWDAIENFTKEFKVEFLQEIIYAKMYHLELFLPAILGMNKQSFLKRFIKRKDNFSPLVLNYYEKLKALRKNNFLLQINTNKYVLENNKESELLIQFSSPSKWYEIHKKI